MSGHSQFKNIMYRKGAQDAKKAKVFAKLARDITIAAKSGLPEPDKNPRLRLAIQAARAESMPKDNIERAIAKATQTAGGDDYVSMRYEGFGPGKVAIIVEALTDNRNRTAGEMRHHFDKNGGNMGASGCVSWSFDRKGVIVIDNEEGELDEDTVMMDALDAGAEDMQADGPVFEITTDPDSFNDVVKALEEKGYSFESAEIEMVPQNYIVMTSEDDVRSMTKLLDMLDDNEDVQNVWHNWQQD